MNNGARWIFNPYKVNLWTNNWSNILLWKVAKPAIIIVVLNQVHTEALKQFINNRSKILLLSTAITILNMSSVIDQLVLVIICYEIRLTNTFINSLTILISIDNICNFNVEK